MKITVNGQSIEVDDQCTLSDLIDRYDLTDRPCAVEINRQLVPKARHGEQGLTTGDTIELVTLVGGG